MELATLARPYAEAVFDLGVETDSLAEWSESLAFLGLALEDPELSALVANPRTDKAKAVELLIALCEEQPDLTLTQEGQNLLRILADNHKLTLIPELARQFEALKAERQGYIRVQLISTYAVKAPQKKEVTELLTKRFGKEVELDIEIDRSLLGGWIIRAGDQVLDLSVRGRLQGLAAELRG